MNEQAEIQLGDTVEYGSRRRSYQVVAFEGAYAILQTTVQSGPRNTYVDRRRARRTSLRRPEPRWGCDGKRWYCPCGNGTVVAGKGVPCGPACKGA
jgi:hypothetical protein